MIIGLLGFIGSGKGAASDILVEEYGFTKINFADTVKDAAADIFGWPRYLLEGDTKESREFREKKDDWWSERMEKDFSPRLAMQLLGTEAGRDIFHPALWIYSLEKRIELTSNKNVVIGDVRFPNEIKFLRDLHGFSVRVIRGPEPVWYDDAVKAMDADDPVMKKHGIHFSEWAWVGSPLNYQLDYQLDNNGTLDELKANINHMLKVFKGCDIIN